MNLPKLHPSKRANQVEFSLAFLSTFNFVENRSSLAIVAFASALFLKTCLSLMKRVNREVNRILGPVKLANEFMLKKKH